MQTAMLPMVTLFYHSYNYHNNILLKISNIIFNQTHPYTIDNWEDYEDNIPEKGGFISNEESGAIFIEYSYFYNCVAIDGGCVYCEECSDLQIYNATFINGISFGKAGNIYAEKTNVIIGNSYFKYGLRYIIQYLTKNIIEIYVCSYIYI